MTDQSSSLEILKKWRTNYWNLNYYEGVVIYGVTAKLFLASTPVPVILTLASIIYKFSFYTDMYF